MRARHEAAARRQVLANRGRRRRIERHDAFLAPLAEDADHAAGEVHVLQIQPDELAETQAGGVEELQDGPVPKTQRGRRIRNGEQGAHFVDGHVGRHAALHLRRREERARIVLQQALAAQVAREGAHRGELACGRRRRLPPFVGVREEIPHEPVAEIGYPRFAAEMRGRELEELRQVAPVGAHGMPREVAVQAQVVEKRSKLLAHRPWYRPRAPPSSASAPSIALKACAAGTRRRRKAGRPPARMNRPATRRGVTARHPSAAPPR